MSFHSTWVIFKVKIVKLPEGNRLGEELPLFLFDLLEHLFFHPRHPRANRRGVAELGSSDQRCLRCIDIDDIGLDYIILYDMILYELYL